MKKNLLLASSLSLLTLGSALAAESEALLKALGDSSAPADVRSEAPTAFAVETVKLTNAVARQIFSEVSAQGQIHADLRRWFQKFVSDDFETTAREWTEAQKHLTAGLRVPARVAYVYSLYRLDLGQTFFNQWMAAMADPAFRASRASMAMEEAIAPGFEDWLWSQNLSISAEQQSILAQLGINRSPVYLFLEAHRLTRRGLEAQPLLTKLPSGSRYRPLLAQTVALAHARKQNLSEAAKTLKLYYDPWLSAQDDARVHSRYSLQIGRLLYQVGSMEGAAQSYRKIPRGSPDFLVAQEELAWVYLRAGDHVRLRGIVESFDTEVFKGEYRPEAQVVRAISDLKLCRFAEVEKTVLGYAKENKPLAAKVDRALASAETPAPERLDLTAERVKEKLDVRMAEKARLEQLAEVKESGEAEVAAHWENVLRDADAAVASTKKELTQEHRRLWNAKFAELQQSTRKLQFVRVELMSRVAQVAATQRKAGQASAQALKVESSEKLIFPKDNVLWPDELFQLRSFSNSQCKTTESI